MSRLSSVVPSLPRHACADEHPGTKNHASAFKPWMPACAGMTVFLLLFAIIIPARADPLYGLAMHGTPKYTADFDHLSYVNPNAPKGGTLKQAAIGTFDSLNPFAIKGRAAEGLDLVYDRLMARVWDEPFSLYPLIAESVDMPEDRESLTIHINPKARFHDGSPVTADDVLFSFETLRDGGRPNMRRVYKLADKAEIIDPHTVSFHFGPGSDRETPMIFAMMPVLSKAWWAGRTFDSALGETPLGNGPYRIAESDPGRRIVYERVPDYWAADLPVARGLYNFDKIVYDYYRDDLVAFEAFKAGDLNFRRERDAGKWAAAYDFPAVKDGGVLAESLSHGRPERVRALIFNTRRPPFDDRRVREALGMALDFGWLNENLFHGQYKRITSYFPNATLAAQGEPSPEERDLLEPWTDALPREIFGPAWQPPDTGAPAALRAALRRADALLKEAGWIVKDGARVSAADGAPLRFEILIDSPEDEKTVLAFTHNLERLGVKANIHVLDAAAFRGRLNDYDYDMVLYYWVNSLSPGSEQTAYWSCESARQPARWNYPGVCLPAIDALVKGIADAQTYDALTAHARALDRVLTWGFYTVPLYYAGRDAIAHTAALHRPAETPLYGTVIESWWAEDAPTPH